MGDLNANVISRKPCEHTGKLTRLHGFTQVIKEPTRVTEHASPVTDFIFVNNLHRFVSYGVQEFGARDHSVVFAIKKGGKFLLTDAQRFKMLIDAFSDWTSLPNLLRKPMPCKIFKQDLKLFLRAKHFSV